MLSANPRQPQFAPHRPPHHGGGGHDGTFTAVGSATTAAVVVDCAWSREQQQCHRSDRERIQQPTSSQSHCFTI
jgi:hypothetical protein